jgi:putative aldouronate transport system permease protein
MSEQAIAVSKPNKGKKWRRNDYELLVMALLGIAFLIVFAYVPLAGIILAFKDGDNQLNVLRALFETDFIGLQNFRAFLLDPKFVDVLLNTLGLNLLRLIIGFPLPIIFALLLNEIRSKRFKKVIQSVSIFPHFLSWVVFGGIIIALCDMTTGIMNPLLYLFGIGSRDNPVNLLTADYFWPLIIIAGLLKGVGWGSVIYLASMTSIDPTLYEVADIDGAGRFRKMFSITLPLIAPTITIYLLLQVSGLLNNSFEQFYVMQNAANLSRSEVLATYIFKTGIIQRRYSYTAALGLFESICGFILLLSSNLIAKKIGGRGLYQ